MLSLRKTSPQSGVELLEMSFDDSLQDDEVLVKVFATGICGSDLHIYDWVPNLDWLKKNIPFTLGHEFSGFIEKIGGNCNAFEVGDKVIVKPTIYCLKCSECLNGNYSKCSSIGFVGVTQDGAFSSHVKVNKDRCLKLSKDTNLSVAALAEPLAVALNAIRQVDFPKSAVTVILGPGTIGQCIALILKLKGYKNLLIVGKNDSPRLENCTLLGIDNQVDLDNSSVEDALERYFECRSADIVFEATGQPSSVENAIDYLNTGGSLVCTGIHEKKSNIDISKIVRKRLTLKGAYSSTDDDWLEIKKYVESYPQEIQKLITHNISLADVQHGFLMAKSKQASKVLVYP